MPMTPRQRAEKVVEEVTEEHCDLSPGWVDAITTALQQQSNEDLATYREKASVMRQTIAELQTEVNRLQQDKIQQSKRQGIW